jgi:protein TonB
MLGLIVLVLTARGLGIPPPPKLILGPNDPIRVAPAKEEASRIKYVAPVYPTGAIVSHTVTIHMAVTVGKDGQVEKIQVISGRARFTEAAIKALRQWEYKPYLLNGQTFKVETTVTITFEPTKPH